MNVLNCIDCCFQSYSQQFSIVLSAVFNSFVSFFQL